ncbi:hypothetical protein CAEBREN_03535 [Caenorhabditis brenneri]|uniref:Uncharacterized protein n=1 Tax=Caenorhabditis brenneri TaxID=135651 RepID=G0MTL6_CAEBE|nr:hypothetical protein CAEBREN_03535 [Caenorhabditis brenneri]
MSDKPRTGESTTTKSLDKRVYWSERRSKFEYGILGECATRRASPVREETSIGGDSYISVEMDEVLTEIDSPSLCRGPPTSPGKKNHTSGSIAEVDEEDEAALGMMDFPEDQE